MTEEEFEEVVDKRLARVKELLVVKAKEYRRGGDPFHNFKRGADITGEFPTKVLDGFLLKHMVSYRDMLNDLEEGKYPSEALIDEKFGDIITYFCIQEALFLKTVKKEDGK